MHSQGHAYTVQPREERVRAFVEDEQRSVLVALGSACAKKRRNCRFAGARSALDERAGSLLDAAAQEFVQAFDAAFQSGAVRVTPVLGGDETRIDFQPPRRMA